MTNLNPIQQMMVDTGMLEIKLPIKHDTETYQVVINGVECDFCGLKEDPELVHNYESGQSICESCFELFN